MNKKPQIIMGIDPGYDRVGVALIRCESGVDSLMYSTCIQTDKKQEDYERVGVVCDRLEKIITEYKIDAVGVETLFVFKNQKTVMSVSEARGAIKYILHKHRIKIIELTPMQVKSSICGDGHADKSQVNYMVRNILRLDNKVQIIDDEIDSMAIAMTASLFYKSSLL